jgi:hypothetical protein
LGGSGAYNLTNIHCVDEIYGEDELEEADKDSVMMNNLVDNIKFLIDEEKSIASQSTLEVDEMAKADHENQMASAQFSMG